MTLLKKMKMPAMPKTKVKTPTAPRGVRGPKRLPNLGGMGGIKF